MRASIAERYQRLLCLHERDGGKPSGAAPYECPLCGIRPMLFLGNRAWNQGLPVIECLCLAPFSPRSEEADFVELGAWNFPPIWSASSWEAFVTWKLSLPEEEEEEL